MSLPFLHSPSDIVRWALIESGLGSDPNILPVGLWPIYCAVEPPSPDNLIIITDTTPVEDGRSQLDGEVWKHYGIQIKIRAQDEALGNSRVGIIKNVISEGFNNPPTGFSNYVVSIQDYQALGTGSALISYIIRAFTHISVLYQGKQIPNSKRSLYFINCTVAIRRLA